MGAVTCFSAKTASASAPTAARGCWRSTGWTGSRPRYFTDFPFPYGFHGPDQYSAWLQAAGLVLGRLQLIPKDIVHADADRMAAWIRTTWLPYLDRLPAARRPAFVDQILTAYAAAHPPDEGGALHLAMVRLEVEATKP